MTDIVITSPYHILLQSDGKSLRNIESLYIDKKCSFCPEEALFKIAFIWSVKYKTYNISNASYCESHMLIYSNDEIILSISDLMTEEFVEYMKFLKVIEQLWRLLILSPFVFSSENSYKEVNNTDVCSICWDKSEFRIVSVFKRFHYLSFNAYCDGCSRYYLRTAVGRVRISDIRSKEFQNFISTMEILSQ
jgi:hypothetical protein